jgi:hypothetical protein
MLRKYYLAIKYWWKGESWEDAFDAATLICDGFKRNKLR